MAKSVYKNYSVSYLTQILPTAPRYQITPNKIYNSPYPNTLGGEFYIIFPYEINRGVVGKIRKRFNNKIDYIAAAPYGEM